MSTQSQSKTEEQMIEQRFGIAEAARRVGRHSMTLRRLEADGKIPVAARDIHGRRAYTQADVEEIIALLNTYTVPPTEKAS